MELCRGPNCYRAVTPPCYYCSKRCKQEARNQRERHNRTDALARKHNLEDQHANILRGDFFVEYRKRADWRAAARHLKIAERSAERLVYEYARNYL